VARIAVSPSFTVAAPVGVDWGTNERAAKARSERLPQAPKKIDRPAARNQQAFVDTLEECPGKRH
jgi:hypothetical protein